MDRIGLETLRGEMLDDCRILADAFGKARGRFARADEIAYEGCAHQLCRMYNALEQMGLRHVFVHAYDLQLDSDKLALLLKYAEQIAGRFPALAHGFVTEVARQHGLDTSP